MEPESQKNVLNTFLQGFNEGKNAEQIYEEAQGRLASRRASILASTAAVLGETEYGASKEAQIAQARAEYTEASERVKEANLRYRTALRSFGEDIQKLDSIPIDMAGDPRFKGALQAAEGFAP